MVIDLEQHAVEGVVVKFTEDFEGITAICDQWKIRQYRFFAGTRDYEQAGMLITKEFMQGAIGDIVKLIMTERSPFDPSVEPAIKALVGGEITQDTLFIIKDSLTVRRFIRAVNSDIASSPYQVLGGQQ